MYIKTQHEDLIFRLLEELAGEKITFEEKYNLVARQNDDLISLIGTGTSGHVFRVSESVGPLVLKVTQDLNMYNREVEALSVLTHPCIISLKGLSTINQYHCLWLEHIPSESLWEYIRSVPEGSVGDSEAMDIFYQLVCAVSYMHSRQISHHDLNSRNILINPATKQVKIIDFGLSVFVEQEGGLVDHGYGTPLYLPLEVLEGQFHDPLAVDVWSLGIILVEVLLQYHPFKMAKSMVDLALLIINRRTCYPRKISRETLNIIDLMLTIDPEERIKIEMVEINISQWGNNCGHSRSKFD